MIVVLLVGLTGTQRAGVGHLEPAGDQGGTDGEVGITFAPDGGADPAEIWLVDDGGYELRVRVVAFTGEIHVDEGER